MSHSLFRFTLSSILLAGCSIAWGQGSPDRAYPMNAEDRINGVTSGGYLSLDEDDRPLNAAGAYPMSTIDRLNAVAPLNFSGGIAPAQFQPRCAPVRRLPASR